MGLQVLTVMQLKVFPQRQSHALEPMGNAREQISPGDRPLEGNTATWNGTAGPTGDYENCTLINTGGNPPFIS